MHGLAQIGNGVCLQLQDATTLTKVCIGAALEEESMHKLLTEIAPVYEEVVSRHPTGRFEQHVYQVHETLKSKSFEVDSYVCSIELNASQQNAVDCIAYCTDMKQCKKMMSSEYMPPISATSNFGKGLTESGKSVISKDQVKRCLKRMEKTVQENIFMREGCYWRKDYFSKQSADARLLAWKKENNVEKFKAPWNASTKVADLGDIKQAIQDRKSNAKTFGTCTMATIPQRKNFRWNTVNEHLPQPTQTPGLYEWPICGCQVISLEH
jgi:hypothetical protein